ncbi:potassium transporter TrkG [Fulvivirga sp.]|uniref:TrkH family potassium uptake protein n=1 Tax=Fulvivirga sp. TaxID=1931237 RepID=UPI0032EB7BF7
MASHRFPIYISDKVLFISGIISLLGLTFDFGFKDSYWSHLITDFVYLIYGGIATISYIQSVKFDFKSGIKGIHVVVVLSVLLLLLALVNTYYFLYDENKSLNFYTALLVFILIMFDLSGRLYALDRQTLHPALVFVLSFMVLIFVGTLLLLTPNATVNGIDFIDALFTSTSAVCVTGLATLNTGQDFTRLGQWVIMFLIQFGALGMLSFTSLFALLFKGFGSFESRLVLKNMINANSLENTFKTLIQIIVLVVTIEAIGAAFIFYSNDVSFDSLNDKLFFSVFHSISAFCNAGFSTLSDSLYESNYRYNYNLQLVIAVLIILGGLGYGVMINVYHLGKGTAKNLLYKWLKKPITQKDRVQLNLSLNTKIVIFTSLSLILFGGILFYLLEYNNSLAEHSAFGKVVTALFGSITTRTAGFNTVDTSALTMSTIMIILLLMWIGASPGSTGGGIKTTTFAVASLNIYQQVFGFKHLRVGWKVIEQGALHRATSIISLSLIMIGLSTFLLVTIDGHLGLMPLAFEVFSAYSTVGLSMGITAELSVAGKLVLVLTMFIGRVGFLTLLTGMVRQVVSYKYSPIEYPEEQIFIN